MKIYLMRHGPAISRFEDGCPADRERFLTAQGVAKTHEVGLGLHAVGARPRWLLTSPYVRTIQTAEIVADVLGVPARKIRHAEELEAGADPDRLLERLAEMETPEVMCVGHGGQLDDVIARATGSSERPTHLKKAGVACLEFEAFEPGAARLVWLCAPKVLRAYSRQAEDCVRLLSPSAQIAS